MKNRIFFIGCLLVAVLSIPQCKDDKKEDENLLKTISIAGDVGEMTVGQEANVVATITPEGSMEAIDWKATVDGIVSFTPKSGTNGREVSVKAVAEGETQIYAVSGTGKVESNKITVTVSAAEVQNLITAISIPDDDIDLILVNNAEKVVNVTAVEPADSDETIEWKATTAGIVTLTPTNNGRTVTVTAAAAGTTKIYAESESGGAISGEITVNVAPQQYNEHALPFNANADDISSDLSYVEDDGIYSLTVTGDNPYIYFMPFDGYHPFQAPKIEIVFEYTTNDRASNSAIFHFFGGGSPVGQTAWDIKIPAASEWTEFIYDLTDKVKSSGWGWSGDVLRFAPINQWGEDNYTGSEVPAFETGFEINIKNPRIRLYL